MKTALLDTEANGLLDELTTMHCAVVLCLETNEEHLFTPDNIDLLYSHLETYDRIIGHNIIGYDLPALRKLYDWEYAGEIIDTLLISRTQRPNRQSPPRCNAFPHSVEAYGVRFGMPKQEHTDWTQYSPEMLERCRQDIRIQKRIYEFLIEEGKDEGWERAHKLNSKLFYYLQRQEEYGWLIDREHFNRCINMLDHWISRIDGALVPKLPLVVEVLETKKDGEYNYIKRPFTKSGNYSEVVRRFYDRSDNGREEKEGIQYVAGPFSRIRFRIVDLDSNKETKEFLLSEGWEPKEWNVNDKGEQTSPKLSKTDPFDGIQSSLGRLVAKRVQCRHRKSQIEGWLEVVRPDGRIGAEVGGIATTGRLKHAVIVNVPNSDSFFGTWMRKGFIAKQGWVLVGTDSKGNQMRQLAARMQDEEFTKAVLYGTKENGDDLHSLNQKRSGVATRTLAKNFFYGCILFGAGDRKTSKILGTSIEAARSKKEEYFKEMPMLREFLDRAIASWRKTAQCWFNKKYNRMEYKNGYIKGLDGRPILVEFEKDILVYYLQSDEAIQMAAAYCVLHKWLDRAGYRWKEDYGLVIWMHDEYVIECKKEIAEHVAELSSKAIAWAGEYFGIKCPHEGESKIGYNWEETH